MPIGNIHKNNMNLLEERRKAGHKLTKKQLQQLAEWKVKGK